MNTRLSEVPKTIEDLAQAITEEWNGLQNTGIAAFIRIGNYIMDAEARLGSGNIDYYNFMNNLPFSSSHAVKFKALAENPEIRKTSNWNKLPSSIFTLYQISLLETRDIQQALKAKRITPDTTRKQIAAHRLQVANKKVYQPFCTMLISSSLTPEDRASLISSSLTALSKNDALTFRLSKEVKKEGLAKLRARAEKKYDLLVAKFPSQNHKLTSLVDHAIQATRKVKNGILPTDWEQRDLLKSMLGIDTSQDIRVAAIYKAARAHKVVCRFHPYGKHDPRLKLWISVIVWCDTGNPKKLQQFAKEKIQGKTNTKTTQKETAMAQAQRILDEYHAFISA
jgi:hypothetical protein